MGPNSSAQACTPKQTTLNDTAQEIISRLEKAIGSCDSIANRLFGACGDNSKVPTPENLESCLSYILMLSNTICTQLDGVSNRA